MNIEIVGNIGCSKCEKLKRLLAKKKVKYDYIIFDDINEHLRKNIKDVARAEGYGTFPLIFLNGKIISQDTLLSVIDKKVKKRNGDIVNFNTDKIKMAVLAAMKEVDADGEDVAESIAEDILLKAKSITCVEDIQDSAEVGLISWGYDLAARAYIKYRTKKSVERTKRKEANGLLSEEFLSKYKHAESPLKQLGSFVYYRTYSRWLNDLGRREYWWETVRRAVEYNCSLAPTSKEEAEKLYDNIFNLRQFLSGRTLWAGGGEASLEYPMSNYNCAGIVIDDYKCYKDLFYVLMIGTGVGFRVCKEDVAKLYPLRTDIKVIHQAYNPIPKGKRKEYSEMSYNKNIALLTIGDSKEAWAESIDLYLTLLDKNEYKQIDTLVISYDNVRPKGERLVKFGGSASGHESLLIMFTKIDKMIKSIDVSKKVVKLRPIHAMDIANIIGENVVCGGVRRTAEITLFDSDDEELVTAKNEMYKQVNGNWIPNEDILHRRMSNNSIMYYEKPNREQLHWHVEQMRYSGEPAFYVAENALKRRSDFKIPNPCGEILLKSRGLCNLTTINVLSFVKDGVLDEEALFEAQALSARAGYRMTNVELELYDWDRNQKEDRLLGCSVTGWQDMVNATNISRDEEKSLLEKLRDVTHIEGKKMAALVNGNEPLLSTTVKPEGTLSLLPTVSSGLHYPHSNFFIRRIRVNANDPLVKVCEELGYPIHPENGQTEENCVTKVIEFPVKAPEGKTKYDVTAIDQLENYKMFMEHYVDHNASITVTVRENEWDDVEQWLWDNWDCVIGISFLPLDDSYYPLLPFEDCTEEEYNSRVAAMKPFNPELLQKYEHSESEEDLIEDADCSTGACAVR